jgi:beta-galactosidase
MTILRQIGLCAAAALLSTGWACGAPAENRGFSVGFGASWYPEQWPEQRWDRDLELMQQAHINVVRIGEFAWSTLEPTEGRYDFAWLDHAISKAATHHIKVVIGTPTAAPPAWLTQKYQDVLRHNEDGLVEEHGNRLQYCFASPHYRAFAREIAEKLAVRYGHNPNVVGWQIDNEISPVSFDDDAKTQFHTWLGARYHTTAALNTRWATAYWSQTYNSFDQVPFHSRNQNPGLLLDFKRFVSDTWVSYVRNQADAMRPHIAKNQFITINSMHWNSRFDHFDMHRQLDMAAWDNYFPEGRYNWAQNALLHDAVRGYKQKNFWLIEAQAGFVNYGAINRTLDPGEMREVAWQAVGHGADALLYWQWRSAPNGQEQYYGTLAGADGEPVPAYAEAKRIGSEFAKAGTALADTTPRADVALIQSYESRWALEFQPHHKNFVPTEEFSAFYLPLVRSGHNIDVISPSSNLDRYKLVIAPSLNLLTKAEADHLAAYVRRGGHLVLGPRSGMKNEDNALWTTRQPGPLAGLLGGHVEQFYALDTPIAIEGLKSSGTAATWAEDLVADTSETRALIRYGNGTGWLSGKPAALTRKAGSGSITYLGAWLDKSAMREFLADRVSDAAVRPTLQVPDDIEICERQGENKSVFILVNHGDKQRTIALPRSMQNVLRGGHTGRTLSLAPHDTAVLLTIGKTSP